jgi:hypothetical protein
MNQNPGVADVRPSRRHGQGGEYRGDELGLAAKAVLQRRAVLYQELYEHDNEEVVAWAKSRYTKLHEEIRSEREREDQRDRGRNESFE